MTIPRYLLRKMLVVVRFRRPHPEDVEQLLLNAKLRDELEPYYDESLKILESGRVPIRVENDFLTAMLAWEKAPILQIRDWFHPPLDPPAVESLDSDQLHRQLWQLVHRLADRRVFLDFTDHLSDRQLYLLILRDILPSQEKMVDLASHCIYFNCAETDHEIWLRYYASEEERQDWLEESGESLPPVECSPYPRSLPRE